MAQFIRRHGVIAFCAGVYVLALLPRLAFALAAGRGDLSLDEIEYHLLGWNLAQGNGYRWFFDLESSFRPPGYPFLLAGIYWLLGPNYFAARVLQTFLGATVAPLTYLLGRRCIGPRAGRWGSVIIALYPPLICYAAALMSERIFIPLLVLVCLGISHLADARGRAAWTWTLLTGFATASAILVRPELTYALPLLLGWLLWAGRNRKANALCALAVTLMVMAAVTPWVLRNQRLTGSFVYLDTRTGYNLYIGYHPGASGTFEMAAAQDLVNEFIERNLARIDLPRPLSKQAVRELLYRELRAYKAPALLDYPLRKQFDPDTALSDIEMHRWGMKRTRAYIREYPGEALALLPMKFAQFWDLEHRIFLFAYSNNFIGPLPRPLLAALFFLLLAPFAAVVLLALLDLGFMTRLDPNRLLLLLPVAFYTLLHTLTFGEARFHYVVLPMLALLAAEGAVRLRHIPAICRRKRWRARACMVALAWSIAIAIWCHGIYLSWDRWVAVFGVDGNLSRLQF